MANRQLFPRAREVNLLERQTPKARELQRYFLEHTDPDFHLTAERVNFLLQFIRLLRVTWRDRSAQSGGDQMGRLLEALKPFFVGKSITDLAKILMDASSTEPPFKDMASIVGGKPYLYFRDGYEVGIVLDDTTIAQKSCRVVSTLASDHELTTVSHFSPSRDDPGPFYFSGITLAVNSYLYITLDLFDILGGRKNDEALARFSRDGMSYDGLYKLLSSPVAAFSVDDFMRIARSVGLGGASNFLMLRRASYLSHARVQDETEEEWLLRLMQDHLRNAAIHEATHAMDDELIKTMPRKARRSIVGGSSNLYPESTASLIPMIYGNTLSTWVKALSLVLPSALLGHKTSTRDDLKEARRTYRAMVGDTANIDVLRSLVVMSVGEIRAKATEALDRFCISTFGKRHDEVYDLAEIRRIAGMDFISANDMPLIKLVDAAIREADPDSSQTD